MPCPRLGFWMLKAGHGAARIPTPWDSSSPSLPQRGLTKALSTWGCPEAEKKGETPINLGWGSYPLSPPASLARLLPALGTLLRLWLVAEVLGSPLPSFWVELGSLGAAVVLCSSFSTLGDTWLPLSTWGHHRLDRTAAGGSCRGQSTGDVRCRGGPSGSPEAPVPPGCSLPCSPACPRG